MHPEFAPVAFIAAFSLLLALPWHWRAGNVATLSIVAWLFVTNIIFAVDALVWADNVDIVGVTWCDITVKLIVGGNFALPAACLCICIHLEQVSSVRTARVTLKDKRRRQIFEASMCFGLPILFMILHYVVQGHRFDIFQDYGCRPSTYFSILCIFIIWIPPILMALASLVFAGLALRHFIKRRISFAAHLDANHSALTTSRYLRLMLMSILQMIWSLGITIATLWFTVLSIPIRPYTSWADVHSNFSRIDQFPNLFTPEIILSFRYALWWTIPASTFIFVAFFAFGNEAMAEYKKAFGWVRKTVFRFRPSSPTSPSTNSKTTAAPPKFQGGISLASFDSKPLPSPPPAPLPPHSHYPALPAPKYHEYDTSSLASSSSSFGPALSYHRSHPADDEHDNDELDDLPDTPSTLGRDPAPDTPLGYELDVVATPTSSFTHAHASRGVPPGDLQIQMQSQSPSAPPARPYTYPSLDASHRGLEFPIGQAV
ncbi:pheromone B beta 1 receptor [Favolaschia claudopus]|uniref:Pheromone B beta 1 receptor n=1 Tax=Favolaschia claudopus TaxID=2862362 RepID=A0AAW0BUW5_9AGAR